jgi:uncharacterized protein YqhQ
MKNVGGQAVIEGVMMKSPTGWSVAVRDPKGDIQHMTVRSRKLPVFLKLPVIRGVVALGQALAIGVKAIEYSGGVAYDEEGEKALTPLSMTLTIATAILLALGLFIVFPLYVTKLMGNFYSSIADSPLMFNLVDGVIRVAIFLLYVTAIGLWKEMRRIYEYHGAEHKVIYAYEAGEDLTVANALKYKPYHPRCGTSFLLIVMVISIIVFSFVPQAWSFLWKFLSRLVLIPAIAGISYEMLKFSAKVQDSPVMGILAAPGMFLQRLTVREPDNSQIEVAIAALKAVLVLDAEMESEKSC